MDTTEYSGDYRVMARSSSAKLKWILVLSLLFAAAVFSVWISRTEGEQDDPVVETFTQEDLPKKDNIQNTTSVSSGDIEQTTVSVYPAPDYDFVTDEIEVRIPGVKREYTIAFVNDLHLITDHASGDVTEDALYTVNDRYESLAITENGIHAEELWPQVIQYLNYYDFDAVILGGDMLDYCSNSNIIMLNKGIRQLKYPADKIMYIRSDHDYGGWYGGDGFRDSNGMQLQTLVLDGDSRDKCIEFEDFMIVGINKSYRQLSEDAYNAIRKRLEQGKPVILATHVPFYSEVDTSLKAESLEVRNRVYYWSYDSENYVPQEEMEQLIKKIYAEDSPVVQIVAAHMHARWDGYVTERIKEHIFAPTFEGKIGIIHVIGE